MARTTVDSDFNVGIGDNVSTPKLFHRRRSFKDIQGLIVKLNPELLKTVISSDVCVEQKMDNRKSSPSENACSRPSTLQPYEHRRTSLNLFPSLPDHTTSNTSVSCSSPLTIFYNGSVTVFDLPKDQAEHVLKFAEEQGANNSKPGDGGSSDHKLAEGTRYDLSMARSKSLKRFLEKRKDRIVSSSPYSCSAKGSLSQ